MAASLEEHTERTPLLDGNDTSATLQRAVDSISPDSVAVANGLTNGVRNKDGDGNRDEEAGTADEEENPLFKGNQEVMQRMHLLFPAICIGTFISSADQTLVVSSYARMGSDLNALNNTSWIATAYFLTLTSFQPLYGKLSDIFGRKAALLCAYLIFGTGCLFCGLSRNLGELVAARAFAGIGGGGLTTVSSILLSDIVPLRSRGAWQGYMNIVYTVGASIGAPLGGALADSVGWRWAFIGQFPICLLAVVAVYILLDLPKTDDTHWLEKLPRIDFPGAFTLVLATFCLLLGLDQGSNVSWVSTLTIASCCGSLLLFALFIFIEMKIASHPFAPGHIIFHRSLVASYISNFFTVATYMGASFYIPLYLQAVDGLSATASGVSFIPVLICSVAGSLFVGKYMERTGRYYTLTISCFVASLTGTIVIYICSGPVFSYTWGLIIGLSIASFGGGAVITTTLLSVLANADPADQAIATACTYLFRSLGGVIGVSLSATVVQQSLRTKLRASLKNGKEADKVVERVRQSLDYIKTLEPGIREVVRRCYQEASSNSFGVSIAVISGGLAASYFIKEKKLGK